MILTTREAAERVRLSETQLERLRLRGGGPDFLKIGRSVRYRERDIEAWLKLHLTPVRTYKPLCSVQPHSEIQLRAKSDEGGE